MEREREDDWFYGFRTLLYYTHVQLHSLLYRLRAARVESVSGRIPEREKVISLQL